MRRSHLVYVTIAAVALTLVFVFFNQRAPKQQPEKTPEELFTQTVATALENTCVRCHGPDKQKGDLRLDSLAAILMGGKSGPALVPGHPEKSLLLRLARHWDPKREMPLNGKKLSDNKLAALQNWIAGGAPWPEDSPILGNAETPEEKIGDVWSDPRNPIQKIFGGKRLDLWSLKPLADPKLPAVQNADWIRNPIDHFVLAKMEAAGRKPAPEADRQTLARRLYFDLLGLPPTPEEMKAFLSDTSPEAYEKLVDKLLDSPSYGEHWARFWLDVVRYSDSNGFDYDEFRPNAWRFRDYVIRSLNADKPYDQFVKEQLAGDEMVTGLPRTVEDQDRLIATGFLRVGPFDNSAEKFGEKDLCRARVMSDLVETTGSAFMGLNMSCCKCHDHKVDPISQADYYRMRAFFEGVEPNDKLLLDLPPKQDVVNREMLVIDGKRQQIKDLELQVVERFRDAKAHMLPEKERNLLATPTKELTQEAKGRILLIKRGLEPTEAELKAAYTDKEKQTAATLAAEVNDLEKKRTPFTPGFVVTEGGFWAPKTYLLLKGDHTQPRDELTPGILSALNPNTLPAAKSLRPRSSGRRTALAEWLFSKDNPLTARVMVNRLWQNYYSEGLVATPNDFGFAGARPSHPELLDWLAREFMRSGWSMKKMHRLMVESATYRQGFSANASTEVTLFDHQQPHRLKAEELRDAMLAVSGRLIPHAGGPPLWPELPQEVLSSSPGILKENDEKTRGWYPSPHEQLFVRSLYLVQKRSLHLPMLESLDLPDNNLSCGRRVVSTVAPQALTLLNSPFAAEIADSFAERLQRESGPTGESRVERAFALAFQRPPDTIERTDCTAFLKTHTLAELCRALMNLNEFAYVD